MAGVLLTAQTPEVALSAATERTVLQITAATNSRVKVLRWGVFFDGVVAAAEPVQVELLRQTTAGTTTALTLRKLIDLGAEVIQTTGAHSSTSTLPTAGDVLDTKEVHPQTGFEVIFPFGREIIMNGGSRLAINCTAPAAVNVRAVIEIEE